MDRVQAALNVFFEEPFWVGVIERIEGGKLTVCKVTFGAEPRGFEVYDFYCKNYYALRFSPAVEVAVRHRPTNPKRMQREVSRQMSGGAGSGRKSQKNASGASSGTHAIGTKSQQALKLQQEQMKTERRISARERRAADRDRRFELKQQKKKEKHRGR